MDAKLKKHRLLQDNEDHFVIDDGEAQFKVAKYMLDPRTLKKISSLDRHEKFACGGEVKGFPYGGEVERDVASDYGPRKSAWAAAGDAEAAKKTEDVIKRAEEIDAAEQAKIDEGRALTARRAESAGKGYEAPGYVVPETPSVLLPKQQEQKAPEAEFAPSTTQTPQAPVSQQSYGVDAGLDKQVKKYIGAEEAVAKQYEDVSKGVAAAYMKANEALAERQKQFEQDRTTLNNEINTLQKQIESGEINPNRLWQNMSTGNKVLASLSMIIGGIGGSSSQNMAVEQINKSIQDDIDAQKANLNNKQTLLAKNMERYNNMMIAEEATRAQLMAPILAQINGLQASNLGPEARAKAEAAKLQALQLVSQKTSEVAKLISAKKAAMGEAALTDLLALSPEDRKSAVELPSGKYGLAYSSDEGREIRTKAGATNAAMGITKRIEEMGPAIFGAKREVGKQLATELKIALMKAKDMNVKVSENLLTTLDDVIDNPTEFKNLIIDSGKLQSLKTTLQDALNAEMGSKVMGYKPVEPKKAK